MHSSASQASHPLRKRPFLLVPLFLGIGALASARTEPSAIAPQANAAVLVIPRVDRPPTLQDFLQMAPDANAPAMAKIDHFVQHDPQDGAPAQERTEVYVGYDRHNFYAVFVCFDRNPAAIRARMARREDIGVEHDQVQLYLDTFADQRRSYGFMINPLGIQTDFVWTDSGGYDNSWDTVWDSSGRVTAKGYVALMAIPFKSLRFPRETEQTWGILFQRVIPHDNENSFYPPVSASVLGRLSQEARITGLENISSGRNIRLVPYGLVDAFRVLDQRNPDHPYFRSNSLGGRAGLDGKFILRDSLVLDFTANPDFRQLESDEPQNTANQRFEVFFPEKRPFFQEGANYFDTPINMYFTRRIENPQFGLRLTGKLGPYGIGLLASDDQSPGLSVPDDDPMHGTRAYFTVGRLTRELWKQSQVGIFYSDREMHALPGSLCSNNATSTTDEIACITDSNRVGGADFTFHFGSHFQMQGQALTSVTEQVGDAHQSGNLYSLFAEYSDRHIDYKANFRDVGAGFVTLMGFFQRPDIRREDSLFTYLFRPEGSWMTSWGPHFLQRQTFDHAGNHLEEIYEPGMEFHLRRNTDLFFYGGDWHELLRPSDYAALSSNQEFNKGGYWGGGFSNSYLKWLSAKAEFFSGKNLNYDPPEGQAPFLSNETQVTAALTFRPLDRIAVTTNYILERLTARTTGAAVLNDHIIRTKIDYQYNKRLSFRTIVQYEGRLTNQSYTDLDTTKNVNVDFLVSYIVHPGTAFYLGYNSNLDNIDPNGIADHTGVFRTNRGYLNDGRVVFAKISYLLRF